MPPKILFLQGSETKHGKRMRELLEKLLDKSKVCAPDLKLEESRRITIATFLALVLLLIAAAATVAVFVRWEVAFAVAIISLILCTLMYGFFHHVSNYIAMKRAVTIAQKAYDEFAPSVVVALSTGAGALLHLELPKIPIILFAPALDEFVNYHHLGNFVSLQSYSYVLIVHGNSDTTTPLNDSIKMVESGRSDYCRLEVLEDDQTFSTVTEEVMLDMVQEAYTRGNTNLKKLSSGASTEDPSGPYQDDTWGSLDTLAVNRKMLSETIP